MRQSVAQSEVDWEVKWRIEPGIDAFADNASSEERGHLRIAMIDLTNGSQIRINRMQNHVKIMPEGAVHIRERIESNAVHICSFDPPHRILNQVLGHQWIFLVEVRHSVSEPSIGD